MGKVKSGSAQIARPIYRSVNLPDPEIGRIQKQLFEKKFDIAVDQVTGMSKWLTASLFAANSGGVLTVLNTAEKLSNPTIAGALFSFGLVGALLSGAALQEIYNRISDPLSELIVYWAEVEAGNPVDIDRQNQLLSDLKRTSKWTWLAPIPGWISGLLFVAAAFAVALGLY